MSKEKQIEWLNRFIDIWDKNLESNGGRHINTLTFIYERFLNKHDLPQYSADELVFELQETS